MFKWCGGFPIQDNGERTCGNRHTPRTALAKNTPEKHFLSNPRDGSTHACLTQREYEGKKKGGEKGRKGGEGKRVKSEWRGKGDRRREKEDRESRRDKI